jgi:hypothetical protein
MPPLGILDVRGIQTRLKRVRSRAFVSVNGVKSDRRVSVARDIVNTDDP